MVGWMDVMSFWMDGGRVCDSDDLLTLDTELFIVVLTMPVATTTSLSRAVDNHNELLKVICIYPYSTDIHHLSVPSSR